MKYKVYGSYALVVFSKNDEKMLALNRQNNTCFLYDFSIDAELKIKTEYSVFSFAFSENAEYVALLLINEKTCDFIKLQIYNTKDFQLVKEILLSDYIKKPFSTFTKMQFVNDTVVMSFVHLDATGSILMTVGVDVIDDVKLRIFENGVIQSVFVNKKNIVLLFAERKGKFARIKKLLTISLSDLNELNDITKDLFDNGFGMLNDSYSCFKNNILVFSRKKRFLPLFIFRSKKRNLFSFDITNEKLNFISEISLKKKKFIRPLQIIGDSDYYVGKCKGGKLAICSLKGCKKVADFIVEKDELKISCGDNNFNLIEELKPVLRKNEVLEDFVFSNTAKYGVLQTNKKTYILSINYSGKTNQE